MDVVQRFHKLVLWILLKKSYKYVEIDFSGINVKLKYLMVMKNILLPRHKIDRLMRIVHLNGAQVTFPLCI